jgi:hypothetical protein
LELTAKAQAIFKSTLPEGHPNIETVNNIYLSIKNEAEKHLKPLASAIASLDKRGY